MSQEPAYEHFRAGREVPFSTIYGKIVQDSMGHLWLGTDQGLYRYDSKEFVHFPVENEITDEEILYFGFLDDGTLWAENLSNQILYLQSGADSLRLFTFPDNVRGQINMLHDVSGNEIQIITKESEGTSYIYTVNFPNGPKAPYTLAQKVKTSIQYIELSKEGKSFSLDDQHKTSGVTLICSVHEKGQITEITRIKLNTLLAVSPAYIHLKKLGKIILDPNANPTLPVYIFDTLPPYQYHILPTDNFNRVNFITDDRSKNIWICTDNGVLGYNQHYQPLFNGQKLLPGRVINTFFQDEEGGYWLGTERDGLYYIPDPNIKFYNKINSSLPSNNITVLANGPDNNIYGGTLSSHLFEIQSNEIQTLHIFAPEQSNNLNIRGIEYLNSSLFVALNDYRHYLYDLKSKQIKLINIRHGGKATGRYGQYILFGSNRSSFLLSLDSSEIIKQFSEHRTNSLIGDEEEERVWISDRQGLKYYDFKLDSLVKFQVGRQVEPRVGLDLAKDQNGVVWVASANEGIFGFRPDRLLYHFTTESGLLSNNCRRVIADRQGLWVATDKGINQIDPQTFKIQSIDRADGLLVENVMDLAITGNQLWAGTTEGLFSIPVKENYDAPSSPKVHISKVKIWEQDTLLYKQYLLPHHKNNLYIEFQGIHFRSKDKMLYQYRMLGIDSNWTNLPSTINFVRYPQLGPGSYRFEVMAISSDGLKSKPAHLDIKVEPAFWKTWWFWLLIFLGILGLTQWVTALIRKRKAKEELYLRRIEQLRSMALRSQMNPHFIFNTLSAILFFLTQNDWKSSVKYLSKFSKLIRAIFDHSKYDKISLSDEIQFLENYLELEKLRFVDRVSIHLHIDDQLRNSSIMIPPLLIQPLLENAFKHGLFHKSENGILQFSIREQENNILIIIEDNGIGRKKAAEINSKRNKVKLNSSSEVLQERIDMINNKYSKIQPKITLKIIDLMTPQGEPKGTRCEVFIYF